MTSTKCLSIQQPMNKNHPNRLLTLCLSGLVLAGCGPSKSEQEQKLHTGVKFIERIVNPPEANLQKTVRDNLILQAQEKGMVPGMLLAIAASKPSNMPPVYGFEPESTWCLVLKPGKDNSHIVVLGYGPDVKAAIFSEEVETIKVPEVAKQPEETEPVEPEHKETFEEREARLFEEERAQREAEGSGSSTTSTSTSTSTATETGAATETGSNENKPEEGTKP